MRKTFLTALTALALLVLLAGGAAATMIVDTGIPVSINGNVQDPWPLIVVLSGGQWLAGRFTTTETYNITSVKGWMGYGTPQGTVDVVIRSDSPLYNDVSVPGNILYSGSFFAPDLHSGFFWQGVSGVNWSLPAGTYWAAFEVPMVLIPDFGWTCYQGWMSRNAPSPMTAYAYAPVLPDFLGYTTISYWGEQITGFGMQVEGNPVPLPSTLLLLGSALAGLGGWRRFRRS